MSIKLMDFLLLSQNKTTSKSPRSTPWVQLLKYMTSCVYFMHVPRMPIVTIQERKWSAILMNKLNLIVEDFTGKRITILAQLEQEGTLWRIVPTASKVFKSPCEWPRSRYYCRYETGPL
jgi:hypothetical protein